MGDARHACACTFNFNFQVLIICNFPTDFNLVKLPVRKSGLIMGGLRAGVSGMSDIRPFLRIIFYSILSIVQVCNFQVRIGDYDLSVVGETSIAEKTLGVAAVRRHENFIIVGDYGNSDWDVAVLELSEHLDLETVTPSCLARTSDRTSFDGDIVDNIEYCLLSAPTYNLPSVTINSQPFQANRRRRTAGARRSVAGVTRIRGVHKICKNFKQYL